MAIIQNGYTLADDDHSGIIHPLGTRELPVHVRRYFGLRGEGHVVGKRLGRDLIAEVLFEGFATRAALKLAIADIDALVDLPLLGTVTQTIGGSDPETYAACTFKGVDQVEPKRRDALTNLWFMAGFLRWRQRV